ncbi:MAG TPA: hypothetical protein VGJ39_06785 [Vicinamibacterales bacterium]|jgi:hypothetical protein
MSPLVCQAIRERRLVRFYYDGGTRDVEPHCHGFSPDGNELLSGYQVSGFSRSGQRFGWKMFSIDAIRALIVSDEAFAAPRAGYDPNDVKISNVHCRL